MNYLAHAYLSFDDEAALVGNMISDFVKGRSKFDYSPGILHGIDLHRSIDRFTDDHPAVKLAKDIFRPVYRLYSGALVDVVFDHFLAIDPVIFNEQDLLHFSRHVYAVLDRHEAALPPRFRLLFPYMKEHNWLYNYRLVSGAEKSLGGVVRRAAYIDDVQPALEIFRLHYQPLQEIFRQFWPDLRSYAYDKWQKGREKRT